MCSFEEGELIIYTNGDRYEIGKIKRLCEDGAFVWYHNGETASKTPYDKMHKLVNGFVVVTDTLGNKMQEIDLFPTNMLSELADQKIKFVVTDIHTVTCNILVAAGDDYDKAYRLGLNEHIKTVKEAQSHE